MDESEVVQEVELLTEKGNVDGWRLLALIDAYRAHKEPLDLEDIEMLGFVARSDADLHVAAQALRRGCDLDQLVAIFT